LGGRRNGAGLNSVVRMNASQGETRTALRSDGVEKVTGTGRYTADLTRTGQTYAKFRYTDHSHARIVSIDTTRAKAVPGVVAIITQADIPLVKIGSTVQDRTLFAHEVVRFEGEIIAAVAAMSAEIAEQAAALIDVKYEPLPVVTDFVTSMQPGAQLVHHDWQSDERADGLGSDGNTLGHSSIVKGDAAAAMAQPGLVTVRSSYTTDPSHGVPIEPRAVVAEWQGDRVTIWTSSQVPYAARTTVAAALEVPQANVRVIVPLLGGGT
jgi:CO/xanthine dehydrogenase Mo-binding subunit